LIADFIIWAILIVHNNSMSLWSESCYEREREESLPFQHPHTTSSVHVLPNLGLPLLYTISSWLNFSSKIFCFRM
jgi:hypothetical protein